MLLLPAAAAAAILRPLFYYDEHAHESLYCTSVHVTLIILLLYYTSTVHYQVKVHYLP